MNAQERRQARRIAAWTVGIVAGLWLFHSAACEFACGTSLAYIPGWF